MNNCSVCETRGDARPSVTQRVIWDLSPRWPGMVDHPVCSECAIRHDELMLVAEHALRYLEASAS